MNKPRFDLDERGRPVLITYEWDWAETYEAETMLTADDLVRMKGEIEAILDGAGIN